ncbi:MAG: hypothetical protein HYR94_06340 [Chloroflexi bacterium]|nr:hypothetical protein [Chloroflexota bacterium]
MSQNQGVLSRPSFAPKGGFGQTDRTKRINLTAYCRNFQPYLASKIVVSMKVILLARGRVDSWMLGC